jgi:septal ring factor EnvC (AmiA/AmiB activator)
MDAATKHSVEKKSFEDQINEHARTICAVEDRLDKITNKAKEYQAEITTLRATIDG